MYVILIYTLLSKTHLCYLGLKCTNITFGKESVKIDLAFIISIVSGNKRVNIYSPFLWTWLLTLVSGGWMTNMPHMGSHFLIESHGCQSTLLLVLIGCFTMSLEFYSGSWQTASVFKQFNTLAITRVITGSTQASMWKGAIFSSI